LSLYATLYTTLYAVTIGCSVVSWIKIMNADGFYGLFC